MRHVEKQESRYWAIMANGMVRFGSPEAERYDVMEMEEMEIRLDSDVNIQIFRHDE